MDRPERNGAGPWWAALAAAAALLLFPLGPVAAQGFDMAKGGDQQIQVYADNGIEWQSDANRVIAHGNAKAIRGDMTVTADTLTAYYRQGASGNEIWRIDADGNVTITNPSDTATGTKATYDLDKAVFVLHGQPAKLVTATGNFSAEDEIEYFELQRMAVLRGHGVAIQKDKQLEADVLTAHFKDRDKAGHAAGAPAQATASAANAKGAGRPGGDAQGGGLDLQRADAYGHVVLTSAMEKVTGDRGDYNAETGIATVSGSVKITRQGNELDGGYAHVDLNTGISKLFGGTPGGGGDQRASGVFVPEKKDGEQRQSVFHGNAPTPKEGTSAAAPAAGGAGQ